MCHRFQKRTGFALVTLLVVSMCFVIAITAVIEMHGDNPIENAADMVINKELGTNIDISDIMQRFDEPKKEQ